MPVAGTVLALSEEGPVEEEVINGLLQRGGVRYTPISDHLHSRLRPYVRRLVPADDDYDELFDRVEVLLGLAGMDAHMTRREGMGYSYPSFGRFTWKHLYTSGGLLPEREQLEAFEEAPASWGPIAAGMFGSSAARAAAALTAFSERAADVRSNRF